VKRVIRKLVVRSCFDASASPAPVVIKVERGEAALDE
jgi:hypothetical protein